MRPSHLIVQIPESFLHIGENKQTENANVPGLITPFSFQRSTPNLSAFPNPTTGIFWINFKLPAPADIRIKIFNVFGDLVKNIYTANQQSAGSLNIPVDLSKQPHGVYDVSFICNGRQTSVKILLEKITV